MCVFPSTSRSDRGSLASALTPFLALQKICPAFTKEAGKPEAHTWLETFGPAPLARLQEMAPGMGFVLDDVIAMMMFCGYESVVSAQSSAPFAVLTSYFLRFSRSASLVSVRLISSLRTSSTRSDTGMISCARAFVAMRSLRLTSLPDLSEIPPSSRLRITPLSLPRSRLAQRVDPQPGLGV
jgi:hypothetical protein